MEIAFGSHFGLVGLTTSQLFSLPPGTTGTLKLGPNGDESDAIPVFIS